MTLDLSFRHYNAKDLDGHCVIALTVFQEGLSACTDEESQMNELRVDFFYPVLDQMTLSLNSRFNEECTAVMKLISSLVLFDDDFVQCSKKLAVIAKSMLTYAVQTAH